MTARRIKRDVARAPRPEVHREDGEGFLRATDWVYYLVREKEKTKRRLGCVMHVGSNYFLIGFPDVPGYGGWADVRVHFDEAREVLVRIEDPEGELRVRFDHAAGEVKRIAAEIEGIVARLGLEEPSVAPSASAGALSRTTRDPEAIKAALVRAKEKELPALQEELKNAHRELARWTSAPTLPLKANRRSISDTLKAIDDRLFNVSLYAGLEEQAVQVREGSPSRFEPLRVMQRLCFMDEECLIGYRHGGMEFKQIGEFDEWLAEEENFSRLLPFPRCCVAFRVRRERKERCGYDDLAGAWIKMRLEDADRSTFLYVRNGEQLWRVTTPLQFDETLFPTRAEFDPSQALMVMVTGGQAKGEFITRDEFEISERRRKKKLKEAKKLDREWRKANPDKSWIHNPHRNDVDRYERDHFDRWHPVDPSDVYHDDAMKKIGERVSYANRVALIVQGLYDRSTVLSPHPPVRCWTPEGFTKSITLVRDLEALHDGDAPDLDAYIAELARSIKKGSVTIGQEDAWERREAKIENERYRALPYHRRSEYWRARERYRPYGDPGPGFLAIVDSWSEKHEAATFRWKRAKRRGYCDARTVSDRIIVSRGKLFNVSAYTPGDYLRFFADPRTRALYLSWAPAMLTAEEYHAGNLSL